MWNDAYAWAERILAALVGGAVSYLVTFFAGTLRERKNEKAIRALEGLVSNVNARIDDLCSRLNSAKGTDKLKDADGSEGGNEHDDQATAAAPKSVAKSRWDGFEAHYRALPPEYKAILGRFATTNRDTVDMPVFESATLREMERRGFLHILSRNNNSLRCQIDADLLIWLKGLRDPLR